MRTLSEGVNRSAVGGRKGSGSWGEERSEHFIAVSELESDHVGNLGSSLNPILFVLLFLRVVSGVTVTDSWIRVFLQTGV